jgi:hypothetical protein
LTRISNIHYRMLKRMHDGAGPRRIIKENQILTYSPPGCHRYHFNSKKLKKKKTNGRVIEDK